MRFSEIIGHSELKKELIQSVDSGRVAHAQLFIGESGYGSLSLAIAYSQYLNCKDKKDGDSCGVCSSCFKYEQLQHPDLHFVYPINKSPHSIGTNSDGDLVSLNLFHKWREIFFESTPKGYFSQQEWYKLIELGKNSQGIISKGEANSLSDKLNYKSVEGGYKVVIIWLAEYMNLSSANALLKLFEEPTGDTLFIFISEDSSKIIKTVISRTQPLYVKRVSRDDVYTHLVNSGEESQIAEIAAELCKGDIILAYDVINKLKSGEENPNFSHFTKLMRLCFAINHLELMEWGENMALLSKEEIKEFLFYSVDMLRGGYMKNIGLESTTHHYPYEVEFLSKFAPYVNSSNIEQLLTHFEECLKELSQNVNTKIVLIHFTLAISKLIKL